MSTNLTQNASEGTGTWNQGFFKKSTKDQKKDYSGDFIPADPNLNYNFELFDPGRGKLGKREIRINRNLLNPDEFGHYWQTGKHANHKIFRSEKDLNGDGIAPDYFATNQQGQVVGFNDM